MTDDYVHLSYWPWSVPVQTTVERVASASLNAFLAESAAPCHESSVSGSNDPMSADLHDDTSASLLPVLGQTKRNPSSGAFPRVAESQHGPSRQYVTSGTGAKWTGTGEFTNCGRNPLWI